jgi:hypothetical protein
VEKEKLGVKEVQKPYNLETGHASTGLSSVLTVNIFHSSQLQSRVKEPGMMADDQVFNAQNQIGTENQEKRDSISKDRGEDRQDGHNLDAEEKHTYGEVNQLPDLQRKLKSRHLQMIAIGKRPCFQ